MLTEKQKEDARRRNREWYARNRDAQRERGRIKRAKTITLSRERSREYNKKNLQRLAVIARNRRARLKASGGKHTLQDIAEISVLQKGKCAYCRDQLDGKQHIDHILPIALGGSNDRTNLQILCKNCNKTKSARHPLDFARSIGMLL